MSSMDVMENDLEEKKRMISECLKIEIELKQLEKKWRVKKERNLRIKQHNELLGDNFVVQQNLQLIEHWQVIKLNECRVVLGKFQNHNKCELKTTKQFQCQHPGCGKKFTLKSSFYLHMNIHNKKFQCQVCQLCVQSQSDLQIHLRIHTDERPFVCDWVGCCKQFTHKHYLKDHIIRKHFDDRRFHGIKKDCGNSLKTKNTLLKLRNVHSSFRPIYCYVKECNKKFNKKSNLVEHVKRVHIKVDKFFHCQYPGCERKFTTNWLLNQHMNLHTKKNQCQLCQKCFPSPSQLETHLRIHTGERPFVCEWNGCGWRFKQKQTLKIHIIRKHSDERPFRCKENGCDKSFKRKENLKLQLQTHLSHRPFQCQAPGCGKRFKRKSELSLHVKRAHFDMKN